MKTVDLKFKCDKCEEEFPIRILESVDVKENPELKSDILNDRIYHFKCPKCEYDNKVLTPFLYIDSELKYAVQTGEFNYLFDKRKEIFDKIENLYKDTYKDFRIHGAISTLELNEKVFLLDEDLDIVVCEIMKAILEKRYIIDYNNGNTPKEHLNRVFFDCSNGKLCQVYETIKNENEKAYYAREFDMNVYNDLYKMFEADLGKIDGYLFNKNIAKKLLGMDNEDLKYND